jgi:DNA-binding response OmpR family regulator
LQQASAFRATIAASSCEALAMLECESFYVVISDAVMPDMNGRDFRRTALERAARVPIVTLSAASLDELGWGT